jgi:hypothetical protein
MPIIYIVCIAFIPPHISGICSDPRYTFMLTLNHIFSMDHYTFWLFTQGIPDDDEDYAESAWNQLLQVHLAILPLL